MIARACMLLTKAILDIFHGHIRSSLLMTTYKVSSAFSLNTEERRGKEW